MELFNDHIKLFGLAVIFFIALSIPVAILPAKYNQDNNAPLPSAELVQGEVLAGKRIFIENGCVACHTQQVRNVAMDKIWGERPNVAADYAVNTRTNWWMNTATLMGTERTGPDLTNVGTRLPSVEWHLMHLYNPRAVVEESIMPAYPWLFEHKTETTCEDRTVNIAPELNIHPGTKVVATPEALQLVAYLQSLKQAPLTQEDPTQFLYEQNHTETVEHAHEHSEPVAENGRDLYAKNCQACHQSNGEGLPGAFPSLKGSKIVAADDPEILISIIMKGYNAREEFGEMPAIGAVNNLSAEEITAIINHERTSWGNSARTLTVAETEKIIRFIKQENRAQ